MGYEIAGGLGVKMAAPDRASLRDGRRRLVPDDGAGDRHRRAGRHQAHDRPARQPRLRQHRRPVASRSAAAASARAIGIATPATGELDGDVLPVDLAANAASLGATRVARGHARRVSRGARRRGRPRRRRSSSCRSIARRASAATSRGGTCRSPKCRRLPRCRARAPRMRRRGARSASFCKISHPDPDPQI